MIAVTPDMPSSYESAPTMALHFVASIGYHGA